MTYALMLIKVDGEYEQLSRAEHEFDTLVQWWSDLRAKGVIVGGAELGSPTTAITVSWDGREPIVTDGPHLEAKESVGGIAILDVATQEEAIEIAKSWPAPRAMRIEVRPIVPHA